MKQNSYDKISKTNRLLAAVDCIIFGFDGQSLKILLIQSGFEPEKGKWSLMGGFIQPNESSGLSGKPHFKKPDRS